MVITFNVEAVGRGGHKSPPRQHALAENNLLGRWLHVMTPRRSGQAPNRLRPAFGRQALDEDEPGYRSQTNIADRPATGWRYQKHAGTNIDA
jgi:hypothetical protein